MNRISLHLLVFSTAFLLFPSSVLHTGLINKTERARSFKLLLGNVQFNSSVDLTASMGVEAELGPFYMTTPSVVGGVSAKLTLTTDYGAGRDSIPFSELMSYFTTAGVCRTRTERGREGGRGMFGSTLGLRDHLQGL